METPPGISGSHLQDLQQRKTQIEEALHSINHQLRVLAEGDNSAHRAKMSTLRSREVGITMELELIEVQIAEAMHPIRTRKLQLQERLREQIPDCERENICGIIEILRNGTWGRTEPPQQDADKWILLVGGKPIAAVDSPSDVSPEKRVALLASSSGTIFFEPPVGFVATILIVAALPWSGHTSHGGNVTSSINLRYKVIYWYALFHDLNSPIYQHPSESTTLDVRAILDSGASFPTLNTFDMRRIDPNSTLSPEASINITTANGVIGAQIFELYVQVINVPNAFALQRVAVAPQFPHVSGNFPWAHCYLAS